MKLNKKTQIIIIIITLFLLGIFSVFSETYSMNEISDEYLSNNIDILNSILETQYDKTNKYSLTNIVDENGKVPAYSYYTHIKSRGIRELKAYDGKIFMGLGDWTNNTGPVKILYYNTVTDKIETSGTIEDEAVEAFTIIDNKLYTTGTDPRASLWDYGRYYIYNIDSNSWEQHEFQRGWIHVFEIVEYNGKLFMCGSTNASKEKTPIQVSYDNGNTFEDVTIKKDGEQLPYNNSLRFYAFIKFKGDLYAYTYSDYYGIYIYDEEKNEFNFLRTLGGKESEYGVPETFRYNVIHFRNNTVFNNNFIYITGGTYAYKSSDMLKYEKLPITTTDVVQDAVVHDDILYTLSYQYNDDKTFSTRIYSTKDLETFNLVYEFQIDTLPFSIEYYEDNIYIGTIWDENSKDYSDYSSGIKESTESESGSLYKIDLNKLRTYLILNKEDKFIEVTKNGITYPVSYTLNSDNSVFNTTLTFNSDMSQKEWELEFSKLESLNLIYTLEDTKKYIDLDSSTSYFDEILNSNITISEQNYNTALQFAESIFSETLNIEDKRFNITTENVHKTEDEYKISVTLTVYNIDDNITSEKYTINKEAGYIYVGEDSDSEIIKSNIKTSPLVNIEVDNNKILVKYNDNILQEYTLISLDTNRKIIDGYMYVSNLADDEISSEVKAVNGNILIEDNKLQIKYNDILLDEYNLIRILSDKILSVNDEQIYISTNSIEEIRKNIKSINAEVFINEDSIKIIRDNIVIAEHQILSINLGIIKEINKEILIPEEYQYDEFVNEIAESTGITYKLFKETTEITNGLLEENMKLKIYYDDKEIDTFNIKNEYIEFDSSINVDKENKYLSNINSNTKIIDILSKINTSGTIIVTNNKDEVIEDTSLIGTGTKITIKLIKSTKEYQVIISGDLDGNGIINLQDIFDIANYVYNDKTSLKGAYLEAADYDNNNIYNLQDIMKAANRYTKEAIK